MGGKKSQDVKDLSENINGELPVTYIAIEKV